VNEFGLDDFEVAGPVQRRSMRDEVYKLLYKRILAGKYIPGEWLRQEEIASLLGVSQTPVREALDQLVATGFAERVPFRGVRVLQLTNDEIADAYVLRILLESVAARLAAQNITNEQLIALFDVLDGTHKLHALEDMPAQRQLNKQFHGLIVAASGNSLLTKLYETVSNTFPDWMLYEYMFRHPELLQSSLENEFQEHKAIAEALAAQDENLAAQKVIKHIRTLGKEFENFLDIPGEIFIKREQQIGPM